MRVRFFSATWIMLAAMAAMGQTAPVAAPVPPPGTPKEVPTAATLERWLEGKENVDVGFAGPATDIVKLRESLETLKTVPKDFRPAAWEGGGKGAGINVQMRVTPESTKKLLELQAELARRGYVLDGSLAHVWSYEGPADVRKKARDSVGDILAVIEAGIKRDFPDVECAITPVRGNDVGAVTYRFPKTKASGEIRVTDITTEPYWERSNRPGPYQVLHLSHIGIIVTEICWSAPGGAHADAAPEEQAGVDKVFRKEMEPLIKLDPESRVWTRAMATVGG